MINHLPTGDFAEKWVEQPICRIFLKQTPPDKAEGLKRPPFRTTKIHSFGVSWWKKVADFDGFMVIT